MGIDWVHERVQRVDRREHPLYERVEYVGTPAVRPVLEWVERVCQCLQRVCEQIDRVFHRTQRIYGHRLGMLVSGTGTLAGTAGI